MQRISQILTGYKFDESKSLWENNTVVRIRLENELDKMDIAFRNFIRKNMEEAIELSNQHTDETANKYLEKLSLDKDKIAKYFLRQTDVMNSFLQYRMKGMDLSYRVWKKGTSKLIKEFMKAGLTEGRSAAKISQDIRQLLKEPNKRFRRVRNEEGKLVLSEPAKAYKPGRGVYRSSYKNALRLARNETNIAYRTNDHNRIQKLDFVKGIRVKLSPSHPEYDICDELVGLYPKQFLFTGWHPQCICYTTTELMTEAAFINKLNGGDAAVPITRIPARAARYIKKNTEKLTSYKNRPYWLKDNFKTRNGKLVLQQSSQP